MTCFFCDWPRPDCRCVGSCHTCNAPVRDADLCADCQVEADALVEVDAIAPTRDERRAGA